MSSAFAGTAARVAGGIGMVACAAVIALTAGGGNLLGGLGGLFGSAGSSLQVARTGKPSAAIVATPVVQAQRRAAAHAPAHHGAFATPRSRRRPAGPSPTTRHPTSPAQPTPAPAPATPPAPPVPQPAPAPTPNPGGGQVVTTVGNTVKQVAQQVTQQLPQPVQPLAKPIDDAIDTLVKTCTGLAVCP